jgi:hypothetical protein
VDAPREEVDMGKLSRDKGKRWERAVAALLRPIFGGTVKRGLAQARFGASEDADVKGVPEFWVECKHGRQVNLRAALEQARGAESVSRNGATRGTRAEVFPRDRLRPVACCKDDRKDPVVVMYLDDFVSLLQEWWSLKCGEPILLEEGEHAIQASPQRPPPPDTGDAGSDRPAGSGAPPPDYVAG